MNDYTKGAVQGHKPVEIDEQGETWAYDLGLIMRAQYPRGTRADRICPFKSNVPHARFWYAGFKEQAKP